MTPQRFRQRPSRVVPSVIVAALVALVGGVTLWAGIVRVSQGAWPPLVTDTLRGVGDWTWGSAEVLVGIVVLGVAGLLLLLCVVVPGHRPGHALAPRVAENARETVTDRGLQRIVAAGANRVDGVESAYASGRGRSLTLSVSTPLREATPVANAVRTAADATVSALPLVQTPTTKVALQTPKAVR